MHNRELDFKGTSVATAYMDKWCKLKVAMDQEKYPDAESGIANHNNQKQINVIESENNNA